MRKCLTAISVCLLALSGEAVWSEPARPITAIGQVKDVADDPMDPLYLFLYLQTTNGPFYTAVRKPDHSNVIERLKVSVGATATVCGRFVHNDVNFARPYSGGEIWPDKPGGIVLGEAARADRFDCPDAQDLWLMSPEDISQQSFHRVRGKVLAAWDGDKVLICPTEGRVIEAELAERKLPSCGETVELVGLPESTLYNLHFNRALWRSVSPPDEIDREAQTLHAESLVSDSTGAPQMKTRLHGTLLRLTGVVRSLPKAGLGSGLLYLDDNGYTVPVNADAARDALKAVEIGCTIEVTGVCVMDVDVWRPNAVFPRVRGYSIVTRAPDDIRVIARPPWLTPARALVVVGLLFAGLVVILLWNYALRVTSERRGRQLADERILRAESDLKVHERTRLAVELHDALSQSLTGIALEMKTVAALLDADLAVAKEHLRIADRSLLACREDLRNCLQDLRSNALEEADMNEAIRKTLAPHVDTAAVSIRFNVPRERITDKTAHDILCIVRELTLNALRHGHATAVKVAGTIDDGKLMVSVRDNGSGFDVARRPGVRQGHFGLQGIQERVRTFNGRFDLVSAPGEGTRATVSLNLPKDDNANG